MRIFRDHVYFTFLAAVTLVLGIMVIVGATWGQEMPKALIIGYQAVPNPETVVKDVGWHEKKLGIPVKWVKYDSGRHVTEALTAGQVDIGLVGTSPCAAAVGVSRAKELSVKVLAMPTNVNAGAAWAVYCASAGIEAVIVMPEDAPPIPRGECAIAGASLYLVKALISDAGKIVAQGVADHGWFDASTLKEPYRIEGKKTMGLELAEQFNWSMPDVILYPTGGGVGIIGIYKALGDFLVLDTIYKTDGCAIAVSDDELLEASALLARTEGTFICPEGAANLRAAMKLRESGWIKSDEHVVLLNTGSGLKYPETVTVTPPVLLPGDKLPVG